MTNRSLAIASVLGALLLVALLAACVAPAQTNPDSSTAALAAQVATLEARVSELQGAAGAANPDAAQVGQRMGEVMDMMGQTRQMMQDHMMAPDHTMPMTGTMPMAGHDTMMADTDQMMQMMTQMQGMMGMGGMMGSMPMTGTMPMMDHDTMMGSMDQMMQMMSQMHAHMQSMKGEGGMMGHTMPMTGTTPMMGRGPTMDMGAMMGHMDHMMQMMSQMQAHMQSMKREGGMMGHTVPMTGTMPMHGATPAANTPSTPDTGAADSQIAEAGGVTVQVTPLNLNDPQGTALNFAVAMDTHSVDLGVDLAQLATLRSGGQEVMATEWQAPAGGGHHVAGTLVFPAIDAQGRPVLQGSATVTLLIRNLAGTPLRTFTWTLGDN